MPLTMISDTVEKGVGKTLQGIALLVRTWLHVWRDPGGKRRRPENRGDADQQNLARKKRAGHLDLQDL